MIAQGPKLADLKMAAAALEMRGEGRATIQRSSTENGQKLSHIHGKETFWAEGGRYQKRGTPYTRRKESKKRTVNDRKQERGSTKYRQGLARENHQGRTKGKKKQKAGGKRLY